MKQHACLNLTKQNDTRHKTMYNLTQTKRNTNSKGTVLPVYKSTLACSLLRPREHSHDVQDTIRTYPRCNRDCHEIEITGIFSPLSLSLCHATARCTITSLRARKCRKRVAFGGDNVGNLQCVQSPVLVTGYRAVTPAILIVNRQHSRGANPSPCLRISRVANRTWKGFNEIIDGCSNNLTCDLLGSLFNVFVSIVFV